MFDVDSASFFISISSLKLIAENPSLMHMKSKWMKIEITESLKSLVNQNILQNLLDFIFYEENSTKRKIIFKDLNYGSFLKEFYQVCWKSLIQAFNNTYLNTERRRRSAFIKRTQITELAYGLAIEWNLGSIDMKRYHHHSSPMKTPEAPKLAETEHFISLTLIQENSCYWHENMQK